MEAATSEPRDHVAAADDDWCDAEWDNSEWGNSEWGNDEWGGDDGDFSAPIPTPLDEIEGIAALRAVFAAEQLEHIDQFRRDALADAVKRGIGPLAFDLVLRSMRLELACVLQCTEHHAAYVLHHAEAMVHAFRPVLLALSQALITERHAEVITGLVGAVREADVRDALIQPALELAQRLPLGSFRRALRKLIDTVLAPTIDERHRDALHNRHVTVTPAADGMAWLVAYLPAVEANAILDRLSQAATAIARTPDTDGDNAGADADADVDVDADVDAGSGTVSGAASDLDADADADQARSRSRDQIRADVLCDLLIDGEVPNAPAALGGIRARVNVTVPALALLGVERDAGITAGYAHVDGVGPIPLDRARELCGTSDDWTRILTHPESGAILSVGRTQYRPPASLRRFVTYRAERCMAPGCGMPASRCDIDHTVAWEHGGETSHTNLAPLCRGHHSVKHNSQWSVRQCGGAPSPHAPSDTLPNGSLEWISPAGRTYIVTPERTLPTFTPTQPSHNEHLERPPF